MDSLGPGRGNKTICKVVGPEMKKKIFLETPFLILLPTYSRSVLFSPGGGNKTICKVTGQEIKIFYY